MYPEPLDTLQAWQRHFLEHPIFRHIDLKADLEAGFARLRAAG